jgi:hypothetical protein
VNLKFKISNAPGRAVSPLTAARSQTGDGAQGTARPTIAPHTSHFAFRTSPAFTLVEILVVVVLMSLIVLALMAVFNSTQAAFRASITQTDVLEGGRSVMGMLKSDLESMTPSFGQSNLVTGAVNFYANTNQYQYQFQIGPLVQSLIGVSDTNTCRTNVLENFFILTRQNMTWTGVGYVVDTSSTNYVNPLYRFSMSTNVQAASPVVLYTNFLSAIASLPISPANANMSHLMDGVVHLTVRPYDINGRWMTTNVYTIYGSGPTNSTTTNRNAWFSTPTLGEVGFYMFSNTLPASVEIQFGILEDRTLQRAVSLPDMPPVWARSNYLAQHAGQVHLFRQRFPIRNVDPSAYR